MLFNHVHFGLYVLGWRVGFYKDPLFAMEAKREIPHESAKPNFLFDRPTTTPCFCVCCSKPQIGFWLWTKDPPNPPLTSLGISKGKCNQLKTKNALKKLINQLFIAGMLRCPKSYWVRKKNRKWSSSFFCLLLMKVKTKNHGRVSSFLLKDGSAKQLSIILYTQEFFVLLSIFTSLAVSARFYSKVQSQSKGIWLCFLPFKSKGNKKIRVFGWWTLFSGF